MSGRRERERERERLSDARDEQDGPDSVLPFLPLSASLSLSLSLSLSIYVSLRLSGHPFSPPSADQQQRRQLEEKDRPISKASAREEGGVFWEQMYQLADTSAAAGDQNVLALRQRRYSVLCKRRA